jgi:hypothetical protein
MKRARGNSGGNAGGARGGYSTGTLFEYFRRTEADGNSRPIQKPRLLPAAGLTGQGASTSSAAQGQGNDAMAPPVRRPALVSHDAVEALGDLDNARRREAYLAHRQSLLDGQLRGGVVNDLLFKLPTCGNCRSRSTAWLVDTYADQAPKGESFYKETHSFWYLGGNCSHFKIRLAVPAKVASLAEKKKAPFLIQVIHKRKYKHAMLRRLRWLSTVAYCWLLMRGKSPVEVQAAYDGTNYYFTENSRVLANELKNFDWRRDGPGMTPQKLRECLLKRKTGNSKKAPHKVKLGDDAARLVARFKRHKAALESDAAFAQGQKILVPPYDKDQHAETKLINYFLQKYRYKGASVPAELVVAGVRRPCFVCFARLQAAADKFRALQCTLVHKPRPGPYWPSDDALANIAEDEMRRLMENLQSGWHIYVNGPPGYEGRNTGTRSKDQTWDDFDTDSADSGESDDEGDGGGWQPESSAGTPTREQAETASRMNAFLLALAQERQAPSRPSGQAGRDGQDGGAADNAFVDGDDIPDDAADDVADSAVEGKSKAQDRPGADVAGSLYVQGAAVGQAYWGVDVLANDGGGDCLFHALEGRDLDEAEVLQVRQDVAGAANAFQPNPFHTGLLVIQTLLQSGYGDQAAGIGDVSNAVYRLMQAVPGIYAGDDEINQWCSLHKQTVFVASSDGTVREFGEQTRQDLPGDAPALKARLHQLVDLPAIVLWKTANHFERVIAVSNRLAQPVAQGSHDEETVSMDDPGDGDQALRQSGESSGSSDY